MGMAGIRCRRLRLPGGGDGADKASYPNSAVLVLDGEDAAAEGKIVAWMHRDYTWALRHTGQLQRGGGKR